MNATELTQLKEQLKEEILEAQEKRIIKYDSSEGKKVTLSIDIARKYLCSKAKNVTNDELMVFLKICQASRLDPFLGDVHIVKFGQDASIIVGKYHFLKVAQKSKFFNGFKAGIIVIKDGGEIKREGSLVRDGEKLIGGWAEVHRKDTELSFKNEVSMTEYKGHPDSTWGKLEATMIRKVPLVQSLREAFPEELIGLSDESELGAIYNSTCENVTESDNGASGGGENELKDILKIDPAFDDDAVDCKTGEVIDNNSGEVEK